MSGKVLVVLGHPYLELALHFDHTAHLAANLAVIWGVPSIRAVRWIHLFLRLVWLPGIAQNWLLRLRPGSTPTGGPA